MLYRGESKRTHERNNGAIIPRGDSPAAIPRYDGRGTYDGRLTHGETEANAVNAHHIASGLWNGCWISTSRSYAEARIFATRNDTQAGVIYWIDDSLFEQYGVVELAVVRPLHPEHQEVSIRAADCKELPPGVIVKVEAVSPSPFCAG